MFVIIVVRHSERAARFQGSLLRNEFAREGF